MPILRELALDDEGDLRVENGQLVLLEGAPAVAQRVATRLRTFRGEWVFDTRLGTPWLQSILGRGARGRLGLVQSILAERIRQTDGVARLLSLAVSFDGATRGLTAEARILSTDGAEAAVTAEVGA